MAKMIFPKYYCPECKMVLEEDDLVKYQEPSEAWGHTVYEDWWVCPNCGEVPVDYDNQDKTCEDCVFYEMEECKYNGHARETICDEFIGEGE